jgi:hypothetical protein
MTLKPMSILNGLANDNTEALVKRLLQGRESLLVRNLRQHLNDQRLDGMS